MFFDGRTFLLMFRLAFRDDMSRRRRRVVWALLFAIPTLAAVNAFCLALDRILFPGARRTAIRAPIFIIGHARSGTTLMHRLMTADERMSCFSTWELALPSIVQKKLVRALGRLDRRWLGGAVDARIRAWEDRTFARGREMHPMSLTGPEEDDFVLASSCASGFWVTLFPYMRELAHLYYLDEEAPRWRRRVMRFYRERVRDLLYLNEAERGIPLVHCSKNPTFSGRVESLLETFPDARFVVLMRSPYETIPSLLKLMQRNWRASDCDPARMEDSLACLGRQSFHTYRYPLEVLARHPETPHAVVDYRDLVATPKRVVEEVYAELGLTVSPDLEKTLADEELRSREHRAEHVYDLHEFGLTRAEIRTELSDLFERFGWPESAEAEAAEGVS